MKKLFALFITLFFFNNYSFARSIGETEITTEDGIEVFQEEKYYLLKKNVEIISDELQLSAQTVKIYFEEDLYDITGLIAKKEVNFSSNKYGIEGKGNNLNFDLKNQIIIINGEQSQLFLEKTKMYSDGEITVKNIGGSFSVIGKNSKLVNEQLQITGSSIKGNFQLINDKRDIINLFVEDNDKLNIKNGDILMIAKKAIFNKKKSIIELFDDVQIVRNNEKITGDYGILNTNKNSYKVSSNKSKKVKAILGSDE